MNAGGVVRDINSWGTQTLPQRMHRHKKWYTIGDYWTIHFDTSPRTVRSLSSLMRRDPRVIRSTMIKLGDKVEDIVEESERTVNRTLPDPVGSATGPARDDGKGSWGGIIP